VRSSQELAYFIATELKFILKGASETLELGGKFAEAERIKRISNLKESIELMGRLSAEWGPLTQGVETEPRTPGRTA
jgi:hypothetical protein